MLPSLKLSEATFLKFGDIEVFIGDDDVEYFNHSFKITFLSMFSDVFEQQD